MKIKLYLDEDVDTKLAPVLRELGFDAVTAAEVDRRGFEDEDQLLYATQNGINLFYLFIHHLLHIIQINLSKIFFHKLIPFEVSFITTLFKIEIKIKVSAQ